MAAGRKIIANERKISAGAKTKARPKADLQSIFHELRSVLKEYEKKLSVRRDEEKRYELWSDKPIEFYGKTKPDLFFAAIMEQGKYIGFYFMPVYTDISLKSEIHPSLLKKLKGKSCFHIQASDSDTLRQIRKVMKIGYDHYKKKGWI